MSSPTMDLYTGVSISVSDGKLRSTLHFLIGARQQNLSTLCTKTVRLQLANKGTTAAYQISAQGAGGKFEVRHRQFDRL